MAFFSKKLSTLEEVKKAYEDLSDEDKKSFHQSIADRVHESVAAQEREHGQEDGQSAEAREHETLGAEHADGKGETRELHESDDIPEEKIEDAKDEEKEKSPDGVAEQNGKEADNRNEVVERLADRVSALEETLKGFSALKEKMDEYVGRQEKAFGMGGKVIGGGSKNMEDMSADELKKSILSGQK